MSGEVHEWPVPPEIEEAREVSASTDGEVQSLLDRGAPLATRAKPNPWIRRGAPIGAVVLMAAALLLWMFLPWQAALKSGDFVTLDGQVSQQLGESISFTGLGALHVETSEPAGHQLRLLQGAATFSVDPKGADRNLTVLAGDTAVRVTGTVFGVEYVQHEARVWVERGSVEVTHAQQTIQLKAGHEWRPPEPVVAAPEAPSDAAVVSVSEPAPPVTPKPKRAPRFIDSAESKAAFQSIDRAYAIDVTGPGVLNQIHSFLKQYPKSRHRETVLLYQIELSEPIESSEWRLRKVRAFLKAYPKSKHRRGLIALRDHLEMELTR